MSGGKLKSLAKDTAIYGVSSILGRFLNWCLTPLHVYTFTDPVAYGKVGNIYGYIALFMVLLTYGMETGFFRFMNKDDENRSNVYSSSLISLGATSLIFIFFCFTFISPIASVMKYTDNHDHILIMAVVVALDAFMTIPYAYLRYQKRPIRFAMVRLVFIFSNIIFNLFFLLLCPHLHKTSPELIDWFYDPNYGIGYIFVANLISTIIVLLMLLPQILEAKFGIDGKLLKRMLKYSFPLLILAVAGVINQAVASLFYPYLFETSDKAYEQLGIYNACLKLTLVIAIFVQAFRYAYEPFFFSQKKDKTDRNIYAQIMKYFIILVLIVYIATLYYMDVLKYFVSPKYMEGIGILPIAMMGEIFFAIYFNLSIWYKLTDKTSFGARFSILGCVITVLINIIFVPIFGYIASAWATFICNLVIMTLSYFYGQKYFPIKYDIKNVVFYIILTIVFYLVGTKVPIENDVLRLSYRTLLLIVFIAIVVKKDLPLSRIPILNKYVSKKK